MAYQKILVALDRSPLSPMVFEQAMALAHAENAAMILFHCLSVDNHAMSPYTNLYGEELTHYTQAMQAQMNKEIEEVRQWLNQYAEIATKEGIATEWDWKVGDAGRWIRDMVNNWQADLVVIGHRGLRGIREMFLGSVSNYVVHHVKCSVLIVQGQKLPVKP